MIGKKQKEKKVFIINSFFCLALKAKDQLFVTSVVNLVIWHPSALQVLTASIVLILILMGENEYMCRYKEFI